MTNERATVWPEAPYKGLSSYTELDAPLFAGRDDDIARCAALLADWNTRVLVLHGLPGCGKSSFLRAGIIPRVERRGSGIQFARPTSAKDFFITSTADPLAKLASALFNLAARDLVVDTPVGAHHVNLRLAMPDPREEDQAAFVRSIGRQPRAMVKILENLSLLVPETIILIVDQGEEVLTLNNAVAPAKSSDLFFEFLDELSCAKFDLKILIALRTEYLGRFIARLRLGFRSPGIREYYLGELTKAQVKEALQRPSSRMQIDNLGSPFAHYRLSFEPGLIDAAIEQLDHAPQERLGALQIAFKELYEISSIHPSTEKVIALSDLAGVGNVEGSIARFVDNALYRCGIESRLLPVIAQREVTIWKNALCGLARREANGTVTTNIKRISDLRESLEVSRLDFDRTAAVLLEAGLLKPINMVDNQGGLVHCYGIGHDTVGFVLLNWQVQHLRQSTFAPISSSDDKPEDEPSSPGKDIALCLSGGGFRSMLFSLGAVWRLNELGFLPKIGRVSGVGAGAILSGVLAMEWNNLEFRDGIASNFKNLVADPLFALANHTIDVVSPVLAALESTAGPEKLLDQLREHLFGERTLLAIPDEPLFIFSATNLQKVSLFRLSKPFIGDPALGRVRMLALPLAVAVAASNATPPLLAPLVLNLKEWSESSETSNPGFDEEVYLATGSLIDHLGLEAAWNHHQTIFVSDGGVDFPSNPDLPKGILQQVIRTVDVMDQQLKNLRRRQVEDAFRTQTKKGAYWSVLGSSLDRTVRLSSGFDQEKASKLAALPSRLAKLDEPTKRDLVNYGYAMCNVALESFDRTLPTITTTPPYQ